MLSLLLQREAELQCAGNFLSGAGINSSFAVFQDATGRAEERCLAVGIGIGFRVSVIPKQFQKEVYSDLTVSGEF
jgi:ketol-acid reductoisomerase